MRWIWIRHGETMGNRTGCYLGHSDAMLTERGKQQALDLANRLETERISRIFTSDLSRCVQTAEPISRKCGVKPVQTSALRELDFGEWDCKSYAELHQLNPQLLAAWYEDPFTRSPPGGETLAQLGERVDVWLKNVRREIEPAETVVCISHGGPIRWFVSRWVIGEPLQFWQVEGIVPGEMLITEWEGDFSCK